MRINRYKYSEKRPHGWSFQEVNFGDFNLLVGLSASGKTRLLNTIFNLALFVVREEFIAVAGYWDIDIEHNGISYKWEIKFGETDDKKGIVKHELLKIINSGKEKMLVERDSSRFLFLGIELPKLSLQKTSVSLLKEEEIIKGLYSGFLQIMKRSFFNNQSMEEGKRLSPTAWLDHQYKENKHDPNFIFTQGLNPRLQILYKYDNEKYLRIINFFKSVFPFITEIGMQEITPIEIGLPISDKVSILCIKEKHINEWIRFLDFSSGMQKVLLILTDIETLPAGSIYLIDEYENSLGTNAIDFLPSYLEGLDKDCQYIITSHHPYLINNVNPKDWYIFHRTGSDVRIMYGEKNLERFGKSKQQAFIQLLNDSFYTEGVE
jgi:hypothetical protein